MRSTVSSDSSVNIYAPCVSGGSQTCNGLFTSFWPFSSRNLSSPKAVCLPLSAGLSLARLTGPGLPEGNADAGCGTSRSCPPWDPLPRWGQDVRRLLRGGREPLVPLWLRGSNLIGGSWELFQP